MIATKYLEVVPINVSDCLAISSNKLYSADHFLKKELQILITLECNLDVPHLLTFTTFFTRMIKLRIQNESWGSDLILNYLLETEILSYDFCKALICNEYFLKEKLSLLSASSIFIALKLVSVAKERNDYYGHFKKFHHRR